MRDCSRIRIVHSLRNTGADCWPGLGTALGLTPTSASACGGKLSRRGCRQRRVSSVAKLRRWRRPSAPCRPIVEDDRRKAEGLFGTQQNPFSQTDSIESDSESSTGSYVIEVRDSGKVVAGLCCFQWAALAADGESEAEASGAAVVVPSCRCW